ncbi:MAG: ATP-binding cassette domain-containing protein [Mycobacteriales bacterium]
MTPAVEVRDLFCLYRGEAGDVAALRGLSLTVEPGERVIVQGPNGSGKTTLLRVLQGQQPPSAGLVHVRGAGLGYIEQHPARVLRPEISVLDNVALQLWLGGSNRADARGKAAAVLDRLGLAALGPRRPRSLSGGEAQRVGVAAAVAHRPTLVLADEPTGALDRETADDVYDLLAEAVTATGAALLLVSHDAGAGRIADRVVRIRDGRVSEQWRPGQSDETLVVDERGWVRLPEPMRRVSGALSGVVASLHDRTIRLAGTEPAGEQPTTGTRQTVPAGSAGSGATAARARGVGIARGGRSILTGFDITVPVGALSVVQGRSGSGKSTLLRLLAGLDRPDTGAIEIAGTDLGELDRVGLADIRRASIAYMGQSAHLAEGLDVVETLQVARAIRGLPADGGEADEWLAALDLDELRGRPVRALSGGERQRVAMARALSVRAALVLADEPTAHLDEAHAELLSNALVRAAERGTAILAASHDPVLVGAADHVVQLS